MILITGGGDFFRLNTRLKAGMSYVNLPWRKFSSGEGFQGDAIGTTCIVTDGEPEIVHQSVLELRVV